MKTAGAHGRKDLPSARESDRWAFRRPSEIESRCDFSKRAGSHVRSLVSGRRGRESRVFYLSEWKHFRRKTNRDSPKRGYACKAKAAWLLFPRARKNSPDRRDRNLLSTQAQWDSWCNAGRADYISQAWRR